MFWKRWFNTRARASGNPSGVGATAIAEAPPRTTETAVATPARPASRRDEGWFTRSELAAIRHVRDEKQVAQVISRKIPGASREEVLFRYYFSRAVYLGDFELPPLPQSTTQILQLARDTRAEISDYVKVISQDPSLLRAIIDTANSPFFASLSGAATLEQAVVRIGLRQVEQITMLHAMRSKVFRVGGFETLIRTMVQHALTVAVAGQTVAPKALSLPADAFLAGMFHDIGKLVLTKIVGDVQLRLSWKAPPTLLASCFETYHVSFGEIVCRHWDFPEQISEAVGSHHDPQRASEQPLDRTLYVANLLSHSVADDELAQALITDPVVLSAGLDEKDLAQARDALAKELAAYDVLAR